jgi:hypothetical protein
MSAKLNHWAELFASPRADTLKEPLGVTTCRIEHQQRLAALESTTLGGGEQRCADTLPACSSTHKYLRKISAMRLILRQVQNDLNRAKNRFNDIFSCANNSRHARLI